ncbi:hypothetical protein [Halobacteriovorax sp.]|uniref:hypothetical protein n=1 Tax=Halobacteriovorax sp. TaxID=2020862 RepID=UPI0035655679
MFLDSLRFSLENFKINVQKNLFILVLLFLFSIFIDVSREFIGATGETALIIHGLVETIGTCLFYALILNELLGGKKLSTLNFFTYLRINILYSILYLIGSVFLIIPGLYILTFFYFAPIIALEGKEDGSYFKKSKGIVKKSPWSVLAIGVSLLLLMSLEFWTMGLVSEAGTSFIVKYLTVIFVNLTVLVIDLYLFSATIYLYRKLSSV